MPPARASAGDARRDYRGRLRVDPDFAARATLRGSGKSAMRLAATALLVSVGCFWGARADTWLQFPGTGSAVFFPPYAIVTAALLRVPPRSWWIVLLAATAGDVIPHRQAGATLSFALLTEIPNCLRAVIAALGLRRFAGRPLRFDTLRGMLAFFAFAVLLAPCAAAFAGAGIVIAHIPGTALLAGVAAVDAVQRADRADVAARDRHRRPQAGQRRHSRPAGARAGSGGAADRPGRGRQRGVHVVIRKRDASTRRGCTGRCRSCCGRRCASGRRGYRARCSPSRR